MPAFALPEMPAPRVAAEPRRADLFRQCLCPREPMTINVRAFFEIDIEKMIGRGPARRRPTAHVFIEAAFQIAAVFVKVYERGVMLFQPTCVNAFAGAVEFARKADAETRQAGRFFCKSRHKPNSKAKHVLFDSGAPGIPLALAAGAPVWRRRPPAANSGSAT